MRGRAHTYCFSQFRTRFAVDRAARVTLSMFIVQTAIHADRGSHHETAEEALAMIEKMIRAGVAEPGEFNVREVDVQGSIVRVFGLEAAGQSGITAR